MTENLKEPSFENVEVGEKFGPLKLIADDHYIKSYAFGADDFNPWYFESSPLYGFRVAPSSAAVKDLMLIFHSKYDFNAVVGLHQKEEAWYCAPIPFGTTLILTGEYIYKYTKRGKGYVVLESRAQDESGRTYVKQRSTEIMRIPENVELGEGSSKPTGRRVKGDWPTDRETVMNVSPEVVVGAPIEPLEKQIFQDQMSVFSGVGKHHHNLHTDIDMAREAGFKDTLAQGMMEACWLSELMDRFFGAPWLSTGSYSVVFLQPIYAGDRVSCKGVVTEIVEQPDGIKYEIEMWVEKEDGNMATAGWGNCLVLGQK